MNFLLSTLNIGGIDIVSKFKDIVSAFQIKDAIEILILTVIFFFAFRFLKGRKAGALILGIAICFVVLVLSEIFEFRALYSIFSGIISSGALVVFVIFQPEIREALERIGSGSIHGLVNLSDRRKKDELYFNVVENICSAVRELSADSTGALIVVERTTRISDIASTGIKINANVSSSLLRNIFFNKAPLHDGAVVIEEGRIAAAGCFLPLTRRTDIDPDLGTRHRAAIGMSEVSDAIIIVVSEETGGISVAFDCELTTGYTPEALRVFLMENLVKSFNGK
ncbi:MAG: diadenylate cyclase CdaA [Clostridia bacterium]|nr:diadenylate cyclase CdaA [Clostridia bacterium]